MQSKLKGSAWGGVDLQGDPRSTPATFRESTFPCQWKGPMLEQKKRGQELLIRLKIPCQTFCLRASCAASWERAAADRQWQSPMIRLTFKQLGTSKKYSLAQQAHNITCNPSRLLLRTNRGMQATRRLLQGCIHTAAPVGSTASGIPDCARKGGWGRRFLWRRAAAGRRGGEREFESRKSVVFCGVLASTPTKKLKKRVLSGSAQFSRSCEVVMTP